MYSSMTNNETHDPPISLTATGRASEPVPSVADLLTTQDVAVALGVSTKTLANYRARGTGPRHIRIGGRVYYRHEDYVAYWATLMGGAA